MLIRMGMGGQLSGSVGGVVASRNRYGAYLRNRTVPVNPNTPRQLDVRANFGAASIAWSSVSAGQRGGWESYANQTPLLNRLGESVTLSANAMFLRVNAFRLDCGASIIFDAPLTPGASSLGNPTGVVASEATGVGFFTSGADAVGPGMLSYGPVVSPGVQSFSGPFSLARTGLFTAVGILPGVALPHRYGALVEGQIRYFRVAASDAEGKLSNIFVERVVVLA